MQVRCVVSLEPFSLSPPSFSASPTQFHPRPQVGIYTESGVPPPVVPALRHSLALTVLWLERKDATIGSRLFEQPIKSTHVKSNTSRCLLV